MGGILIIWAVVDSILLWARPTNQLVLMCLATLIWLGGVGFLDDGTMVVVDGARKMINKTVDITVTSVHQTTAGKMIFGRYDERGEQTPRPAAVAQADSQPGPRAMENTPGGERPPRPLYPEPNRS